MIGHDKLPLYVRDLPTHGKQVMIHLDASRLMCKSSGKIFTAIVSKVEKKGQMTERLVHWMAANHLIAPSTPTTGQVGGD